MIVRVVKMTFREEHIDTFLEVFDNSKEKIRLFNGVNHLELLQSKEEPNVFFTYSYWESEEHLEAYRNSDLFKNVWTKTKPLFLLSAEAWSTTKLYELK